MEKFLKKSLASLMALSMFALAGCSSEGGADSGSAGSGTQSSSSSGSLTDSGDLVEISLWHYYNGSTKAAFDELVSEFNHTVGAEKGLVVQASSYSGVSDLAAALLSSANKEVGMPDMPHIFSAYNDTALVLSEMGCVVALDSYFTNEELASFRQDFLNEGRFDEDENLKILPVAKSTELLFVNETDFRVFAEETGVELNQLETWEGIAQVAEVYFNWTDDKTPEVEGDGFALFGVDSAANAMLVAASQLGEEMYDYSGENIGFGLSETAARRIWNGIIVPYIKGYYADYGSYRSDDVKSGDLLMYVGSTSSVNYFPSVVQLGRAEAYEIEGISLAYPYFEGEEKVVVQQGAGLMVSVSEEEAQVGSVEFLKWFTAAVNNLEFAVNTGYMPVQIDALSLDGVLAVMEENTEGEISSIVRSATEVTYDKLMPEYSFYSNKPFNGSYDTRAALTVSIAETVEKSQEDLRAFMETGMSREEAMEEIVGEEGFYVWFDTLESTISEILREHQW